ncbi:MAG TPA: DUF6542 domain-containing protein [Trebonia sp.]|nr:DUF6542 domain-containing protein [Trebonia sp.]
MTTVIRRSESFSGTYAAVAVDVREPYGPGGPQAAVAGRFGDRSGGWRGRRPGERLTGRGGVLVVFAGCFLGLLVADWVNWGELADAVFFMASSLTAYYVRPSGLLPVVVSPPLLFFAACVLEKALISAGLLAAFSGTVDALASSAGWLFAGTGLTILIALLRGLPSEVRALVLALRSLPR